MGLLGRKQKETADEAIIYTLDPSATQSLISSLFQQTQAAGYT
jgi:hypothetical protein